MNKPDERSDARRNVTFDPALWKRIGHAAVDADLSRNEVVRRACRHYLEVLPVLDRLRARAAEEGGSVRDLLVRLLDRAV